jgi:hypothetical protein
MVEEPGPLKEIPMTKSTKPATRVAEDDGVATATDAATTNATNQPAAAPGGDVGQIASMIAGMNHNLNRRLDDIEDRQQAMEGAVYRGERDGRPGRETRDQELRTGQVREDYSDAEAHEDLFQQQGVLAQLARHTPEREGMKQRWMRTMLNGQIDAKNIAKKMNEGWVPRAADTVPKGPNALPELEFQGANVIGVIGMVLVERSIELHRKYAARNRDTTRNQERAVNENMFRVHDPGTPGFGRPTTDRTSKVTFGRNQRQTRVAED